MISYTTSQVSHQQYHLHAWLRQPDQVILFNAGAETLSVWELVPPDSSDYPTATIWIGERAYRFLEYYNDHLLHALPN